jgi:hypothetical protein
MSETLEDIIELAKEWKWGIVGREPRLGDMACVRLSQDDLEILSAALRAYRTGASHETGDLKRA